MLQIKDHEGNPVKHGRATVNGVRLHYVTAGQGEPLVLVHGVPKTWYYWHRLIPLLSKHYTVIAPDVRGFGDSFRPKDGYDMETIADDIVALVQHLGHEKFRLAGEDWGVLSHTPSPQSIRKRSASSPTAKCFCPASVSRNGQT